MFRKILDFLLLLIALAGGILVWQTGREQARLQARIEALTKTTGDLSVTDPTRVYVLALDTGEPLHFAWRVYLPANYELLEQTISALPVSDSPAPSMPAREAVIRVRFREDAEGRLDLYQKLEGNSTRGGFSDPVLSKVFHGRFDKILVEQLGTPAVVAASVNEPLDFLRLKLPADMEAEALAEMSPEQRAGFNPEFFRLSFGPQAKSPLPSGGTPP